MALPDWRPTGRRARAADGQVTGAVPAHGHQHQTEHSAGQQLPALCDRDRRHQQHGSDPADREVNPGDQFHGHRPEFLEPRPEQTPWCATAPGRLISHPAAASTTGATCRATSQNGSGQRARTTPTSTRSTLRWPHGFGGTQAKSTILRQRLIKFWPLGSRRRPPQAILNSLHRCGHPQGKNAPPKKFQFEALRSGWKQVCPADRKRAVLSNVACAVAILRPPASFRGLYSTSAGFVCIRN